MSLKNSPRSMLGVPALALIAACGLASPARSQNETNVARGRDLVERLCIGCHRQSGQAGNIVEGVPVPSFSTIAQLPHRTPEQLQSFITTPRRPMHAIPLARTEVMDIATYIISLKE